MQIVRRIWRPLIAELLQLLDKEAKTFDLLNGLGHSSKLLQLSSLLVKKGGCRVMNSNSIPEGLKNVPRARRVSPQPSG